MIFIRKIGMLVFLLDAEVLELVHEVGVGLVAIAVTLSDFHLRTIMTHPSTQHLLHLLPIILVLWGLGNISLKVLRGRVPSRRLKALFQIRIGGLRILKYSFH